MPIGAPLGRCDSSQPLDRLYVTSMRDTIVQANTSRRVRFIAVLPITTLPNCITAMRSPLSESLAGVHGPCDIKTPT